MNDPIPILTRWLEEARNAEVPGAEDMTLSTASSEGQPSARVVSLKGVEAGMLIFTTGLWTRKAEELRANPHVAVVFHWPTLGRQVRVEGCAEIAERDLAEELFAARPRDHQLHTLVSRQGQPIDDIDRLKARLEALKSEKTDQPLPCPADWGAVRLTPEAIEFWTEGAERLHDRLSYRLAADGWHRSRLAP